MTAEKKMQVNILLLCMAALAIAKAASGYKKGMVKEIISLVSLIVLCVVAALAAYGLGSYRAGNFFHVAVVVILLSLLGLAHHLLSVLFFSAKLVTKLPVVHGVNKLLGAVFGLAETVLLLWTIYSFSMMLDFGAPEAFLIAYTQKSPLLTWLYEHNYLAYGIKLFLKEFQFVPLAEIFNTTRIFLENLIDR